MVEAVLIFLYRNVSSGNLASSAQIRTPLKWLVCGRMSLLEEFWYEKVKLWDVDSPDSIAPLNTVQQDLIADLRAVAMERPLPKRLAMQEDAFVPEDVEPPRQDLEEFDAAFVEDGKKARGESLTDFEEGNISIMTAHEFLKWFSALEADIVLDDYSNHAKYLADLKGAHDFCSTLAGEIEAVVESLLSLTRKYEEVSKKTLSLHTACEHILAEQAGLCEAAEEMDCRLTYFDILDELKEFDSYSKLYSKSFGQSLTKLDTGIAFLKAHPKFKDSPSFLPRYEGALYRMLSMVRSLVMAKLADAFDEVCPNVTAGGSFFGGGSPKRSTVVKALTLDQAFPFLYGRYRAGAPEIRSFVREVEIRTEDCPLALSILQDMQNHYFSLRRRLLFPVLEAQIGDLMNGHKDEKCLLLRSGSHCWKTVCHDESDVFSSFFDPGKTDILRKFIAEVCSVLYDSLRPILVHVVHLETLTELGVVGRAEIIDEDHAGNRGVWVAPFNEFMVQVVEDVRERLVFAAHVFINRDILGFSPSSGDVAYPEKLQMMQSIAESIMREEDGDGPDRPASEAASTVRSHTGSSAADLLGMWYPTVRRTLVCLAKLYRSLDKSTFEGLSQEALAACITSLVTASDQIAVTNAAHTFMDCHLFIIKHLLILREQIFPFRADFIVREMMVDFSRVKDAARNLATRDMLTVRAPGVFLEFLLHGLPDVVEHVVDSKRDLDMQLKHSCTSFIRQSVSSVAAPWSAFVGDVKAARESLSGADSLVGWKKMDPSLVGEIANAGVKNAKSFVPVLLKRLKLYLANLETEFILFRPVKTGILETFGEFEATIRSSYSDEDIRIINCPSKEQLNLLISGIAATSFGRQRSSTGT